MGYKKEVGNQSVNKFFINNLLRFNFNKFINKTLVKKKNLSRYVYFKQYHSLFWIYFLNFFKYFFKINKKILFYYVEVLLSRSLFIEFSEKSHHFFLHMNYPGSISNLRQIRFKLISKGNWIPRLPDFVCFFSSNPILVKEAMSKKVPFFIFKNISYGDTEIIILYKYYFMLSLFKTISKISKDRIFKNYFFNFFKKKDISIYSYRFNKVVGSKNFL